jgi:outer membrane protein OmpA-like peptidoglycan-associated protein
MTTKKKVGRPGPAITIGIPAIAAAFLGSFGYQYMKDTLRPAPTLQKSATALAPITFKVAGDPWSGYSTFRKGSALHTQLVKEQITVEYIDDEKYYDQNERMAALARGDIDIAVTTLDAFLQQGAKHKDAVGQYPGAIVFGIDESAGGDAIFLAKGRKSFDDVKPSDQVCFAAGTPSEHLWDFASLSFASLSDKLGQKPGVVAKDCWEKLSAGEVQVAVLWQPYTAIAAAAGYPKVFATGGQADDVILDIAVANRKVLAEHKPELVRLASTYFKTIDTYAKNKKEHAAFVTSDCGPDCGGDGKLGSAVLDGIDFLTMDENLCIWFGLCDRPSKLLARVDKTGKLLSAKGKIHLEALPEPSSIVDDSILGLLKQDRLERMELARAVSGPDTVLTAQNIEAKDPVYAYTVPGAEGTSVGTLQLPNVFFPEGSYAITKEASGTIELIAETLRSFPALCVRISGHTSSNGNADANRVLSRLRAQAIGAQLTRLDAQAFPKERFDVRGFGSDQPIVVDGKEDANASRRTEFTLVECRADG